VAGKSTTFANELLKLIFNATNIANVADNASASPITNWELSLHTAIPTVDQSHNEVTYTGYARVPVARTSAGFVVTGNAVSPANTISFGACAAGTMTATYLGLGIAHSGAGSLKFAFPLSPAISIYPGQTPRILNTSVISEL
jgi:hypothetical protein